MRFEKIGGCWKLKCKARLGKPVTALTEALARPCKARRDPGKALRGVWDPGKRPWEVFLEACQGGANLEPLTPPPPPALRPPGPETRSQRRPLDPPNGRPAPCMLRGISSTHIQGGPDRNLRESQRVKGLRPRLSPKEYIGLGSVSWFGFRGLGFRVEGLGRRVRTMPNIPLKKER